MTTATPTLTHRPAAERGHFNHGWLDTSHTFSFASYHDPQHMGFRSLRVINEDRVAPGRGFGEHAHANMEIVTLVLDGQLEHRDSMGNGAILTPGEIQYMSAASGVRHSEFNPDAEQPVHFYQIWIEPSQQGGEPRYAQSKIDLGTTGVLPVIGGDHAMQMRQDAAIAFVNVLPGETLPLPTTRPHQWVQTVYGSGTLAAGDATLALAPSDGAAVSDAESLQLTAGPDGVSVLLFDLA